jgi:hypothetical protein
VVSVLVVTCLLVSLSTHLRAFSFTSTHFLTYHCLHCSVTLSLDLQVKLEWGAFGYFSSSSVILVESKVRVPRAIRIKSSASSTYVPRVKKERDADDGGWNASPRSSALDPVSSQSYGFSRMKKQKHSVTGEDVRLAMRAVKEENSLQSLARSDGRYQFVNPFLHEVVKRIVANIGMGGQVSLFILRHHACFFS